MWGMPKSAHFYTPVLIILKGSLLTFISSWVPIVVGVSFLDWGGFLAFLGSGKSCWEVKFAIGWYNSALGLRWGWENPLGPDSLGLLDRTVPNLNAKELYFRSALKTMIRFQSSRIIFCCYRRIHHLKFLAFHGNQLEYNGRQGKLSWKNSTSRAWNPQKISPQPMYWYNYP